MRRPLHCVIVALLCLNLCVDSARACWHVRRRSQCCPPPVCSAPSCGTRTVTTCAGDPAAWIHGPQEWAGHVVLTDCGPGVVVWADAAQLAQCCVPDDVAYAVVAEEAVHDGTHDGITIDGVVVTQDVVDHVDAQRTVTEEAVVHSPTIVLGTAPAAVAEQGPQVARPVAPQPQAASREPLPDLRPATADAGTLPRADQPVPASLDLPEQTAARTQDAAATPLPAAEEMPAPAAGSRAEPPAMPANPAVDDLALAPGDDTPREENLFDLFAVDDDAGEQAAPTDEPEMTEERTTDGDDAEPAPAADDAPTPPAKDAPAEEADDDAVEATASTPVPDEPLRQWTDATGDHHAQGWLVEIDDDEALILKVSGRHTTMALTDLSADDQAYVSAVAARLAAGRSAAAAANDTAGL